MYQFTFNARHRRSPYFESTVKAGVAGFMTYNRMMLPTGYGNPEAEYWRIINGVSLWDVGSERQVELAGRDAAALAQILTPRDLSGCAEGQGKYVALCSHDGVLINDPILLKVTGDRFWLSIADNNILLWAKAVAAERGLDVHVTEPDVSPLAVQGPKAEDVVAAVFGDWVRDVRYFWFRETAVEGIPVMLGRSGWSKQGGFELYLMDGERGNDLWNIVAEAGRPWDIGPGSPDFCERIESGLLSWGGDTDDWTNPLEVRMERYVDLGVPDDVIGIGALRQIAKEGPKRRQLGIVLDGDEPMDPDVIWWPAAQDGRVVGHMTNRVWSRRLEKNIGYALVDRRCAAGERITVETDHGRLEGRLAPLPFIP